MITKSQYSQYRQYAKYKAGEDYEDVLQNALLRAWRFKDNQEGNFDAWIRKIVFNESNRRFERSSLDYSDIDIELLNYDTVSVNDDEITLNECISTLPDRAMQSVTLRIQGYTSIETAKIMNVKTGTICAMWNKSNQLMRDFYND